MLFNGIYQFIGQVESGFAVSRLCKLFGVSRSKKVRRLMKTGSLAAIQPTSYITYIPLVNGRWACPATRMDLFSRGIVGWQADDNMEEDLIVGALPKALGWRKPTPGLIIHSDRGGQYVGNRLTGSEGCSTSITVSKAWQGPMMPVITLLLNRSSRALRPNCCKRQH